ncbi:hypothetical protein GGR54DRAFT_604651 [Hypoxylon sp. NC1633]|nr:hypothetical protein GGR54DRAFT_604651 [Hypoxylon sp. NC1633]
MQFFATLLALATAALAAPNQLPPRQYLECSPPSYGCKPDFTGWLVCNINGTWLDGGCCESDQWCESLDGLPYCIGP